MADWLIQWVQILFYSLLFDTISKLLLSTKVRTSRSPNLNSTVEFTCLIVCCLLLSSMYAPHLIFQHTKKVISSPKLHCMFYHLQQKGCSKCSECYYLTPKLHKCMPL